MMKRFSCNLKVFDVVQVSRDWEPIQSFGDSLPAPPQSSFWSGRPLPRLCVRGGWSRVDSRAPDTPWASVPSHVQAPGVSLGCPGAGGGLGLGLGSAGCPAVCPEPHFGEREPVSSQQANSV